MNMHSKEYVIKIIEECGYTTYEVMRQVMEYTGSIVKGLQAVSYLRQYKAKDIRKILKIGGVNEHKRNTRSAKTGHVSRSNKNSRR